MFAEALFCLALNAYHEARNQDVRGMIAVTQVVMNRVESDLYPDDPCGVVFQGPTRESWKTRQHIDISEEDRVYYPVKHRCQFSWYCDGKDDTPHDEMAWAEAQLVAGGVMYGKLYNMVGKSLWYHADYVKPEWADSKRKFKQIGDHIFYERKN
jgi:spore germination cell wall hydrolase CwlJ-like protein